MVICFQFVLILNLASLWNRMNFGLDCLNVISAAQIFLSKTHTLLVLFYFSWSQKNKQNSTKRIRLTLVHVFFEVEWHIYWKLLTCWQSTILLKRQEQLYWILRSLTSLYNIVKIKLGEKINMSFQKSQCLWKSILMTRKGRLCVSCYWYISYLIKENLFLTEKGWLCKMASS